MDDRERVRYSGQCVEMQVPSVPVLHECANFTNVLPLTHGLESGC